ncbi:MAG: erythromycin esterase family protein [Gammaproteobacteria bacterium]|nr:erythromycin esterase family protein [Gammaproteobacteria bacterium]
MAAIAGLIDDSSEAFADTDSANLDGLLQRIGDARLVLLGESSHGTAEFYDMRARITRELIEKKGFSVIAIEGDLQDARRIDAYIQGFAAAPVIKNRAHAGFPAWMWNNHSFNKFLHGLRAYNQSLNRNAKPVRFYGLDIYNLYGAIDAVLNDLLDIDSRLADFARRAYSCLDRWQDDPAQYGSDIRTLGFAGCQQQTSSVLRALLDYGSSYPQRATQAYFHLLQSARLVVNAERYYRTQDYTGDGWNQREQHMFESLLEILKYQGTKQKVVIWAHNLHVGDARFTHMYARGDISLGQRLREAFADKTYLIGFGTYQGTVGAAAEWGGSMQVMQVPAARRDSYEQIFHRVKVQNFLLPLRHTMNPQLNKKLRHKRLLRSIGVIFDPTETQKNYTQTILPLQFDEYIWFDKTRAVATTGR